MILLGAVAWVFMLTLIFCASAFLAWPLNLVVVVVGGLVIVGAFWLATEWWVDW